MDPSLRLYGNPRTVKMETTGNRRSKKNENNHSSKQKNE